MTRGVGQMNLGTENTERRCVMAKDPICGMDVDEKKAAGNSEHKGKTYYFCAPGCKKEFDGNPDKYAGKS